VLNVTSSDVVGNSQWLAIGGAWQFCIFFFYFDELDSFRYAKCQFQLAFIFKQNSTACTDFPTTALRMLSRGPLPRPPRPLCWRCFPKRTMRTRPPGPRPRGPLPKKCRTVVFFVPGDLDPWPPNSNLGEIFLVYLTAKFHLPTFNRSEVILLTNKQTGKQTNKCRWKHPSHSTMLSQWVITVSTSVWRLLRILINVF